ncbi:MAG TPA: hypothetical protein VHQ43_08385, partial [Solirubrobacterales bacterium]|nr:hypothetical protein [Solirubrobacterales bacterium]
MLADGTSISPPERTRAVLMSLLLVVMCALLAVGPASARAAEGPSVLWTRCDGGQEDAACSIPRGIAANPSTGHAYVADQGNLRVIEFTAWGEFVRTWGWGVSNGAAEFQICTELSACQAGIEGGGSGQFSPIYGVAVDSTGAVYVGDRENHRVQKFDSEGHFVLMIGGKVNKTKVEAAAPEAQQNRCPIDPGDVCQAGTTGTGNGQFSAWPAGSLIAVGTANRLFVGDKARIQVFNSDGSFKEVLPDPNALLTGKTVQSLGSEKTGNLFASLESSKNVLKINGTTGARQCRALVETPRALAADQQGNLYVFDATDNEEVDPQVRKFGPKCSEGETLTEAESFGSGELKASFGIAAGSACFNNPTKEADVYVSSNNPSFIRAYGEPPNKLATCPRPVHPPEILDQYPLSVGSTSATVRGELNSRFWEDTRYYVQYGTAACVAGGWEASCVNEQPAVPGSLLGSAVDGTVKTAGVLLSSLVPNAEYRFRFVANGGGGGPVFGVGGKPGEEGAEAAFQTRTAPSISGSDPCPNAVFRIESAASLLDCRAYEMVSPIDKEGTDILSGTTTSGIPVARNRSDLAGGKLTFTAEHRFGDAVGQPVFPQYVSSRHEGEGWSTHGISPPRGVIRGGPTAGQDNEFKAFSDDLCSAWLVSDNTTAPPLAPGGVENVRNLYKRSNCGSEGYEFRGSGEIRPTFALELQGFSTNGGVAIFRVEDHLTQDAATPVGALLRCFTPTQAKTTSFQWLRDGSPIAGKTTPNYPAAAADEGHAVQCLVRSSNENAGSAQITNPAWIVAPYPVSAPPEAPSSVPAPSASEPLAVGGLGGQVLTCNPNAAAWGGSPSSFEYQWYRNGSPIAAATSSTYTTTPSDVEKPATFQCAAIATDGGPKIAKASENATTAPAPSGPPAPQAIARGGDEPPLTYVSSPGGALRSLCVLPGGQVLNNGCSAGMLVRSNGYENSVRHAISEDGSRVFWSTAGVFGGPGKIFVRENPAQPQSALAGGECSEPTKACTKEITTAAAQFWGASADGSTVIYRTGTLGGTGELFEYDVDAAEARKIAAGVSGLAGMSEDASRIYLASTEALAGENKEHRSPSPGKPNLYFYDAAGGGSFAFVGTLSEADANLTATFNKPSPLSVVPIGRMARVSPDGGTVAFASSGSPTGYDNRDVESGEADREVYRYDAGSEALDCVSCDPGGARPRGAHVADVLKDYWAAGQIQPAQDQLYASRVLSEDGTRLFFESYEPLVLADTNNRKDVYEWEELGAGPNEAKCTASSPQYSPPAGGCVGLISSGENGKDSSFLDASPSGNDVFFSTGSDLVPQDPGLIDIYDARLYGGFPQPATKPICEGQACQNAPAPPAEITPS